MPAGGKAQQKRPVVKDEKTSLSEDAQAVYDKCLVNGGHVSQEDIQSYLPGHHRTIQDASTVINDLLGRRHIEALSASHGLVYRAIVKQEILRMDGMDGDEAMIYNYIKSAGNEGIWSRHIKARTNLHATVITRNLKSLENKSLVKCIRSVQNPTRKIYMLYDLVPSIEVSGGPWFTDSELDVEFVEKLCQGVERFINRKSFPKGDYEGLFMPGEADYPTIADIHTFLKHSAVTDVPLGESDIQALLEVLIYDGRIERRSDGVSYQAVNKLVTGDRSMAFTEMPCGQCPVSNLCQEGGVVSPEGCEYWQAWLEQA